MVRSIATIGLNTKIEFKKKILIQKCTVSRIILVVEIIQNIQMKAWTNLGLQFF